VSGLPHRPLGTSGIDVSLLALGSWRTYERIPREQGIAVMRAAREQGIDFLDDARYDDETGSAPIATVSNKLWWEFWPEQSAAEELDASLERMGFDHVDLVYSCPARTAPPVEEIVGAVGELIAAGKARAWGINNWEPDRLAAAAEIARQTGVPPPCAAQLPYSLTAREDVEGAEAARALDAAGAAVVASFVLSGGILTGKYADDAGRGRMGDEIADARWEQARRAGAALRDLAGGLGATPAAHPVAFAAAGPRVASVLFGATRPEQVAENAAAVELLDRLTPADLDTLRAIGVG